MSRPPLVLGEVVTIDQALQVFAAHARIEDAARALGVGRNVALRWARELGVHRPPRTLIPRDVDLSGNGMEIARQLGVTKSAVYHARQRRRAEEIRRRAGCPSLR